MNQTYCFTHTPQKKEREREVSAGHEFKPHDSKSKGKAFLLQAWSGPEGSRKLRFPDFMTTALDGGKVVSLTHRLPLPPRKYTWYSLLLEDESTPGPQCDQNDYVTEKFQ